MGNIKIIKGVFDTKLELEHAGVKAGFPSPADDYRHETLDFNHYPVFKVNDPENFQIWGTVIHLIRTFEKL